MNSDRKVRLVTFGSRLGWYNWDSDELMPEKEVERRRRLTDTSRCNQGSTMTSDLSVWPALLCWVTK